MQIINSVQDDIMMLCKKYHVSQFSIFGSAARNELSDSSDIDLLVSFNEDLELLDYADNFFSLKNECENLFGKRVDLVTLKSLKNPILKNEIERFKVTVYEE